MIIFAVYFIGLWVASFTAALLAQRKSQAVIDDLEKAADRANDLYFGQLGMTIDYADRMVVAIRRCSALEAHNARLQRKIERLERDKRRRAAHGPRNGEGRSVSTPIAARWLVAAREAIAIVKRRDPGFIQHDVDHAKSILEVIRQCPPFPLPEPKEIVR